MKPAQKTERSTGEREPLIWSADQQSTRRHLVRLPPRPLFRRALSYSHLSKYNIMGRPVPNTRISTTQGSDVITNRLLTCHPSGQVGFEHLAPVRFATHRPTPEIASISHRGDPLGSVLDTCTPWCCRLLTNNWRIPPRRGEGGQHSMQTQLEQPEDLKHPQVGARLMVQRSAVRMRTCWRLPRL